MGKHGRIRSVPIPDWSHSSVTRWQDAADIRADALFRAVTRHGSVSGRALSSQAVFSIMAAYATQMQIAIRPHDLRRSFAKLAHAGRAPLEQIQLSLGHASIVTTEIYLGTKQNLVDAPCDHLGLAMSPEDVATGRTSPEDTDAEALG